MAAYVIGHVKVLDSNLWANYRQLVPDTFKAYGAEVMIRASKNRCLAGTDMTTNQVVVIQFPNSEMIDLWYQSKSYQDLIDLRDRAAEVHLFSFSAA